MLSVACLWALGRLPGPTQRDAKAEADSLRQPAAVALAVLAGGLLLAGLIASWATPVAQLHAEARQLAQQLVPAATFSDASAAQQAFQTLRHLPQVRQAWLLGSQDQLLAHHVSAAQPPARPAAPSVGTAGGIDGPTCRAMAASPGWALRNDHVLLGQAVRFQDVPVGCLCLDIGPASGYRQGSLAGALALLAWACWRRRPGRSSGTAT